MSIHALLPAARDWRSVRLDPVALAVALIFAVLAVAAPAQAAASASFTAKAIWSVLPFFAVSIGLTAYAKASGAENLIAGAFAGRPVVMVVFASLMGALSPFCSCGVIPVIAALLATGVPLAPVMAFWLASPLMDPSMFFITAGILGAPFAVAKTVAAIGVGLLGGFGVLSMQQVGLLAGPPSVPVSAMAAAPACGSATPRRWCGATGRRRRGAMPSRPMRGRTRCSSASGWRWPSSSKA